MPVTPTARGSRIFLRVEAGYIAEFDVTPENIADVFIEIERDLLFGQLTPREARQLKLGAASAVDAMLAYQATRQSAQPDRCRKRSVSRLAAIWSLLVRAARWWVADIEDCEERCCGK